ncbi:Envelope glycoprotein [Toxocara canis]|uniref:Envelope glycoprotein n=1 Tax=Toxocara canis TaxID=6265 RepID=A0A0B2VPR7_TOXCA|nr:Envelope glycoprotein [Toxocara canis]
MLVIGHAATNMLQPTILKFIFIHGHWKSDLVSKRIKLECPPKPFCELIHCYFCLTFIENPHCAPKGALILLGFIIYLSLSIIYLLFTILRVIIACSYTCSRLIILCSLQGVQYIIRRIINLRSSSPPERKHRYFRSALRKTGALIVIAIPLSYACSISTLLQASQSSCLQYENGSLECILTTSARLMVAPQGQQSCLLLKDMNSKPLGTLTIQLKKIALRCKKKSLYFTRSFQMAVASSKRCSAAGSCSGNKCTDITIDTKLPEFEKYVNDAPGFTYCTESCGCAACGCFLCDSACLFYRTYARPTSEKIYEVFSCPSWEYLFEAIINIRITGKESEQHIAHLIAGLPYEWNRLKITLIAISQPPIPLLTAKFISDEERIVQIDAAAPGQAVATMIGKMQCANRDDAQKFNCFLPKDICTCQPRETVAARQCEEQLLEHLFTLKEHILPLETHDILLKETDKTVEAQFKHSMTLEAQVDLQGFQISTIADKNTCEVTEASISGCYNCLSGALITASSKSSFGTGGAHVECDQLQFSLICEVNPKANKVIIHYDRAKFQKTCSVHCPGGKTNFHLEGILNYIDAERLSNISNIVAEIRNTERRSFDLSFFFEFFKFNIISTTSIILVVFVCLTTCHVCIRKYFFCVKFHQKRTFRNFR